MNNFIWNRLTMKNEGKTIPNLLLVEKIKKSKSLGVRGGTRGEVNPKVNFKFLNLMELFFYRIFKNLI